VMIYGENTEIMPNTMPASSKLRDRWTGPFQSKGMTRTNTRVLVENLNGGEEEIHVSRIAKYHPWDETGQPSVDSRMYISRADRTDMNKSGRRAEKEPKDIEVGDLCIFPLTQQDGRAGYGIGEFLRWATPERQELVIQWRSNAKEDLNSTFKAWWWRPKQQTAYIQPKKAHRSHVPYTNEHTGNKIHIKDVADIGFELKANFRVPTLTLERASEHPSFRWKMDKSGLQDMEDDNE